VTSDSFAHFVVNGNTVCGAPVPVDDGVHRPRCPACSDWVNRYQPSRDMLDRLFDLSQARRHLQQPLQKPKPNRIQKRHSHVCACLCSLGTGQPCKTRVFEPGERFCLPHRDRFVRARIKKFWTEKTTVGSDIADTCIPHRPWRQWRALTEEDIWSSTTVVVRNALHGIDAVDMRPSGVSMRDDSDEWYKNATALYRVPAASNWAFGRHRTHVRKYREGCPHRNG
jgi:hypothetical protein